ncbi:MAG: DUF4412 domain-containing protein [Bacteroidales bacterium]|nr:DUF4412 domain-containing protein [Bacteroidales bacterium]
MLSILISFMLIFTSSTEDLSSFEGSIEMVQKSFYETSYFTYFVKNNKVRIDKFDRNHDITQSIIVNVKEKQVYILSPEEKLYVKLNLGQNLSDIENKYTILKTGNSRLVNGYKCYQWRVKNIEKNTEVAYWVWQNNFYLFSDLVKLLIKADNTYCFFNEIPETYGFFPMLSVERTLLRREKLRTSVVNINPQKLDVNRFNIPQDFEIMNN